jgi:hypothetical protein
MWEIISGAHNIQRLHQTRQRILATRQWAFVWCHRRQGGDWWYLCGSIVFPVPHNENWLHANVDRDSSFYLPHHNPNPYRNHEIGLAEAYEGIGHEVIILIDDGPFH